MEHVGGQVVATHESADELDRLGDEIAELAVHFDAATARLLELIREFDTRGGWNHGFRSCAHWLSWRVGLELGAAREHVRVARALGTLPGLTKALERGELSYSKVRAITRVATPETEERLIAVGKAGTACHVERSSAAGGGSTVSRRLRRRHAATRRVASRVSGRRRHGRDPRTADSRAGRVGHAGLGGGARDAIPAGTSHRHAADVPAETSWSWEQQQADALALVAESALQHDLDPGAPGERYQVVVHVDAAVLADPDAPGQSVLDGGTHVPAETSRRLACDAARVVMRHESDGRVVEVGARTRTIPPAIRRALHHRDRGCRFPGCGLPFGQGHHIRHWAQGGGHDAVESRHAVPGPPPRRARRGLRCRATRRRHLEVQVARRKAACRRPAVAAGAR